MSNVAAGTVWNLPNYLGELFTASHLQTPFLTMMGGPQGARTKVTKNFEFPVSSTFAHEAASQPAITETASLTAPTPISYVRDQEVNVVQIFHEAVSVSYARLSGQGRLSGINTAGGTNPVQDEFDFQIARALEKIARDLEYTFLNGVYAKAANAGQANKTRGILAAITANTVDASSGALSKALIDELLKEAFANGAVWQDPVIFTNAYQKVAISDIYGYAPTDRNVGGVAIKQIETDFGNFGIVLDPFMPADELLFADMAVVAPVVQPVPDKGVLFYEPLAKTGAGEEGQVFGQLGLDHGPEFRHASITNLADS